MLLRNVIAFASLLISPIVAVATGSKFIAELSADGTLTLPALGNGTKGYHLSPAPFSDVYSKGGLAQYTTLNLEGQETVEVRPEFKENVTHYIVTLAANDPAEAGVSRRESGLALSERGCGEGCACCNL